MATIFDYYIWDTEHPYRGCEKIELSSDEKEDIKSAIQIYAEKHHKNSGNLILSAVPKGEPPPIKLKEDTSWKDNWYQTA